MFCLFQPQFCSVIPCVFIFGHGRQFYPESEPAKAGRVLTGFRFSLIPFGELRPFCPLSPAALRLSSKCSHAQTPIRENSGGTLRDPQPRTADESAAPSGPICDGVPPSCFRGACIPPVVHPFRVIPNALRKLEGVQKATPGRKSIDLLRAYGRMSFCFPWNESAISDR